MRNVMSRIVEAADTMTADLRSRPDVVASLRQPGADFVFVEEGLDATLLAWGCDQTFHYIAAFGLVMAWLGEHHGVQPPAWFLRACDISGQ